MRAAEGSTGGEEAGYAEVPLALSVELSEPELPAPAAASRQGRTGILAAWEASRRRPRARRGIRCLASATAVVAAAFGLAAAAGHLLAAAPGNVGGRGSPGSSRGRVAAAHRGGRTSLWLSPPFKRVSTGSCADIGMVPIMDRFYCEYAAMDLGLPDISAVFTDFLDIPEGCYYFQDSTELTEGLWIGTNRLNRGKGAETSNRTAGKVRRPICILKIPDELAAVEDEENATASSTITLALVAAEDSSTETSTTPPASTTASQTGAETSTEVPPTQLPWQQAPGVSDSAATWAASAVAALMALLPTTTATTTMPAATSTMTTTATTTTTTTMPATTATMTTTATATTTSTSATATAAPTTTPPLTTTTATATTPTTTTTMPPNTTTTASTTTTATATTTQTTAATATATRTTTATPTRTTTSSTLGPPKEVLKGICYAPVPFKASRVLENDDFMSEDAAALWRSDGRKDLRTMRELGANTVRLYGNDPRVHHGPFLDEARRHGLQVILGMSDYPYIQMPGNCATTKFNCFSQIRAQYLGNLKNGFLSAGGAYHPALRTVTLMNEPDLKFFPVAEPWHFCKAMVSAFDAVLDAEKEAKVKGPGPNFTATFSFAVCFGCRKLGSRPALGQMLELQRAMRHPKSVGYNARNDLWAAYQQRFVNSFNTANPAWDIRPLFLDEYDARFQGTPVFIGEYHCPAQPDQLRDLRTVLRIAADRATLLQGLAFFEFQVRYDKGGSELSFGIFGLGGEAERVVRIGSSAVRARCLAPMRPPLQVRAREWQRRCGIVEDGIDYVVESAWGLRKRRIPSAGACCTQCKLLPQCQAWTWSKRTKECSLKGAKPTSEGMVLRRSVVSGLPPPRKMLWKELLEPHAAQRGDGGSSMLVPAAVAKAFGGQGVSFERLCPVATIRFYLAN